MSELSSKVSLVNSNGVYMIFNATDYIRIRKDYRITGNLIGVTAGHTYDSTINGLPAVYSPFEAKLLLDEGIAQLVATPNEAGQQVQEEYREFIQEQLAKQTEKNIDKSKSFTESDLLYQVPTECLYRQATVDDSDDLLLPTPDPIKYKVFLDLWKRKNFITNGHSFGGDFLIYPHDPIVCHASHVIHVLDTPHVSIRDFITVNRLCVGVKKECVFAYLDPESEEKAIKYQSSVWDSSWD